MNRPNRGLKDADKCIELQPDWAKGYYRKSCALLDLLRFEDAIFALKTAVHKSPQDRALRNELARAEKQLRAKRIREKKESTSQDSALPSAPIQSSVKLDTDLVAAAKNSSGGGAAPTGTALIPQSEIRRRLYALASLFNILVLRIKSDSKSIEQAAVVEAWVKDQGGYANMSNNEKAVFDGKTDAQALSKFAFGLLQSIGTLNWVLAFSDTMLPTATNTHYTPDDPKISSLLSIVGNVRLEQFINQSNGKMRDLDQVAEARQESYVWFWRFLLEIHGKYKNNANQKEKKSMIKKTLSRYLRSKRIPQSAVSKDGSDLLVGKQRVQDLSNEEMSHMGTIYQIKHQTLNWVLGHAKGNNWDQVPVVPCGY
eukprot:TRINITY_DN8155_c0_g1_i1.p1 TRINITY_DN8155_c0_g1~~TRINITY_DN8155_c0_g1_i1.p1  ORF type:complete len:417 (-),score=84.71 TRINITY_DN8155_c0_g1_i1:268-1374(-)